MPEIPVALVTVVPPSVEIVRPVAEAATTTLPLVDSAKPFQLALAADSFVQVAFSPPGFTVFGIVKLGMSFTLVMSNVTVATPEFSRPTFTLKVKLSAPDWLAAGV